MEATYIFRHINEKGTVILDFLLWNIAVSIVSTTIDKKEAAGVFFEVRR